MADSILILGAGFMQKPAIVSAKKLGLKVYVVDGNPEASCIKFADCFEQIDLKERDKIAAYARNLKECDNLKAVFTAGTDFSANVAFAAESCGFPGHSYEACENATNKALMRQCFRNARVPSPHFILLEKQSLSNVLTEQQVSALKFPYVVKPVDNMGARGCRMARNKGELFAAARSAMKYSRRGKALLEEYMDGREFSIDALLFDGTFTVTGFAERHIFYEPYFIEMGHTMPAQLPYSQFIDLIKTFALGCKSLGLTHGAAKADIKWTKNGPMVGEIAARLSGGYMSGWTMPYSSDLNLTEQAILLALGRKPETLVSYRFPLELDGAPYKMFVYRPVRTSAERAWVSIPGRVEKVIGLEEASKTDGVRDVFPRAKAGDVVDFPRNNVEKCGNVVAVGKTRAEAVSTAENAVSRIVLALEKNNSATESFLQYERLAAEENFPPSAFDLPQEIGRKIVFELDCKNGLKIPEGEALENYIPPSLVQCLDIKDFNHRSLQQTIAMFDKINPSHPELDYKRFWLALIRGGLQGALYVS